MLRRSCLQGLSGCSCVEVGVRSFRHVAECGTVSISGTEMPLHLPLTLPLTPHLPISVY